MVIKKKTYYKAKYGGRYTVTMLPGHGIGPEMMAYVREVFRYCGAPIDFEEINMDAERDDMDEVHMAITSIKRNGVALKGNIETKVNRPNFRSRNVELRQKLKLFAYVMHTKSFPGIITRHKGLDVIIIRQNTEGEYAMLEHEVFETYNIIALCDFGFVCCAIAERGNLDITQMRSTDKNRGGVVESLKICTMENSKQLAKYAFEYARKCNRKKVTAVHKANIMKLSDGLFLSEASKIAKDYPDIAFDNMIIDNCCMQMVSNPQQFDVMVTSNLYGNIIGNLVCGLVGGAGLLSGINYGERYAVFEPGTRNTGSSIVGKNIANPIAMLTAGADLLEHLKLNYHGSILRDAISQTVNVDKIHTPDLGGQATSLDVVQNIIKLIQAKSIKW
uniref:Isopropylmalate dehydrogenase-like domain-containing protein n=1 Tax=Strigamia maritima TaxID=126957 RepID=T1IJM3_STRMM